MNAVDRLDGAISPPDSNTGMHRMGAESEGDGDASPSRYISGGRAPESMIFQ